MNFLKTVLLFALVASLAALSVADFERKCVIFGHGHVSAVNGRQYRVSHPGDYVLAYASSTSPGVTGRFTQCPGSTAGAVCMTAVKIDGVEYYWNTEANSIEKYESSSVSLVEQNIEGHEVGYTAPAGDVSITLTSNGLLVSYDFNINNKATIEPYGLCGNDEGLNWGPSDVEAQVSTSSEIQPNTLNADDNIQSFIKSWLASYSLWKQTGKQFDFQYRRFPASKEMGDFSAWKVFSPDTSSIPDTCATIAAYSEFLGAACAYDVAATGREESRFSAHWVRSPLCKYMSNNGVMGLNGLFADYEDYAKCFSYFDSSFTERLHQFNAEKRTPNDDYMEVSTNDFVTGMKQAVLSEKGNRNGHFGVTSPVNVGGKYTYNVEYKDNCGTVASHEATLNIRCNNPPTVDAGSDVEVQFQPGNKVILRVKMSDPDGDNLAVAWKIIDWPNRVVTSGSTDDLNDYVSNQEGFDSEYFAFDMKYEGKLTVQVAVSDYCNVVYDTVTVDMVCTQCTEKLYFEQTSGDLMYPATDIDNPLNYGSISIDFQSLFSFETNDHRITPADTNYIAVKKEDTNNNNIIGWEIRTAYTENKTDSDPVEDIPDPSINEIEDDSYFHKTYIPTLDMRGYVISEKYDNNDDFYKTYLRTARNVLSQRYKRVETTTNTTEVKTTISYNPPSYVHCEFNLVNSAADLAMELVRTSSAPTMDTCSQVWHLDMNATSDCDTDSARAIITSDCPVPQSNPYCPEEVVFDYASQSFPEITLNGRDSTSGASRSLEVSDEYPIDRLNYKWKYESIPADASASHSVCVSSDYNGAECTTTLQKFHGEYVIALEVDNNCRSNSNTVLIKADCPVGAPTNLDAITVEKATDGLSTVYNATYAEPGENAEDYDISLHAELFIASHPSDAVETLNTEIRRVRDESTITTVPTASPGIVETNVYEVTHNEISYDDKHIEGDYQIGFTVTDHCKTSSKNDVDIISISCEHDPIKLETTVDHMPLADHSRKYYFNNSWPNVPLEFEAVAADEANNNLPPDFTYIYREQWVSSPSPVTEETNTVTYSETLEFTGPGTYEVKVMALHPDFCRYTEVEEFSVEALCPEIPVFEDVEVTEITSVSTNDNNTQSFTFSAVYHNAEEDYINPDMDINAVWRYFNGENWQQQLPGFVVEADSNNTYAHLTIEELAWMEAGEYKFKLEISNDVHCGRAEREFTFTVECPNPNFQTEAQSSAETYKFENNRFPIVEVTGTINNIDDEEITPKEFYRYSWIFTEAPENSAYHPYLYYNNETEIEPTPPEKGLEQENRSGNRIDGREYTTTYVTDTVVTKIYERTALNFDRMAGPSSISDFSFNAIAVEYEERLHGCFIPDVQGDYTLELETRFNETDFCHETPAQVNFKVECNEAPVVSLRDAVNKEISVTKSATNPQRVQLHLDAEDPDGDQLSIHWTWESTPYASNNHPNLMDDHARQPSFLAEKAGKYKLNVAVDDGCTREVETYTVKVSCTDTIAVDPSSSSVTYDYDSSVDISQFSMSVAPEYSNKQCSGAVLQTVEFVSWEAPDIIPDPSSSASDSESDDVDSDVSPASRAVAQPTAAFAALVVAVLALLM